jgi:hypothetical protein
MQQTKKGRACPAWASLLSLAASFTLGSSGQAKQDPPLHWYRCNTHTHTSARPQSDANETPEYAADWYRTHGYQCLVITDHEFLTDVTDLNKKYAATADFLVIRGQEITQAVLDPKDPKRTRYLHVNGIDIDRAIMPVGYPKISALASTPVYERNLAEVRSAGGIPQINHPNLGWSVRLEDLLPLQGPYLFEVWNAFPTSNNLGGTADDGETSPSTEALWDELLTHGQVAWGVASDDTHEYHRLDNREAPTPGKGWIVIEAKALTLSDLHEALKAGHFYASTGVRIERYEANHNHISIQLTATPDWSPVLKASARFRTRFIGARGRVLTEVTGTSPEYHMKGDESYVRASIIDSDGRRAWTEPVFLDGRETIK